MTIQDRFNKTAWNTRIITLRIMMGLNQQQLADRIGTTRKNIYLWEQGKTEPRNVSKRAICNALESTEQEIFGKAS